ncbi:MAG: hypothetical protein JWM59_4630 [Verrucomicrobiales bacterium]|nr:hypothetical protein [Verrucomicrobiales bacterium]
MSEPPQSFLIRLENNSEDCKSQGRSSLLHCPVNGRMVEWVSFHSRFGGFTDTLIKRIEIDPNVVSGTVTFWLESREAGTENWKSVRMRFESVESFAFKRSPNNCIAVISHGINAVPEGNLTGFEFGDFPDPPPDLAELRRSRMHLIASSVTVRINDI